MATDDARPTGTYESVLASTSPSPPLRVSTDRTSAEATDTSYILVPDRSKDQDVYVTYAIERALASAPPPNEEQGDEEKDEDMRIQNALASAKARLEYALAKSLPGDTVRVVYVPESTAQTGQVVEVQHASDVVPPAVVGSVASTASAPAEMKISEIKETRQLSAAAVAKSTLMRSLETVVEFPTRPTNGVNRWVQPGFFMAKSKFAGPVDTLSNSMELTLYKRTHPDLSSMWAKARTWLDVPISTCTPVVESSKLISDLYTHMKSCWDGLENGVTADRDYKTCVGVYITFHRHATLEPGHNEATFTLSAIRRRGPGKPLGARLLFVSPHFPVTVAIPAVSSPSPPVLNLSAPTLQGPSVAQPQFFSIADAYHAQDEKRKSKRRAIGTIALGIVVLAAGALLSVSRFGFNTRKPQVS